MSSSSSNTASAREQAIAYAKASGATDVAKLPYECGDCSVTVYLGPGDPVHCNECGCRIFYKKRTSKVVQYNAR